MQDLIRNSLSQYLLELRKTWEDSLSIIVRISQIEARILNVDGVLDVTNTMINENSSNIEIAQDYLPVLGSVEVQI